MIATTSKEEGKRSERKVEANDNLRTIECLRGRLISERQASRAAKDVAELMGIKLMEMEDKLEEEIKLRNKAEKKLKFLKKKLESLKILLPLEESEQSSSSENSFSGLKDIEESESKPPEISESISSNQSRESSFISSTSSIKDPICQDSEADNRCFEPMQTSIEAGNGSAEEGDYVGNPMVTVPVTFYKKSQKTNELTIMRGSVTKALEALRNERGRIQNSMDGRRTMTRIDPS